MKKLTALLAAGLVLGASGMAMAVTNGSADGTATATIIAPIIITNSVDLAFGNVVADTLAAGTVILSASGTPERTPDTVQLPNTPGIVTAAKFTIAGATDFAYTVTLPTTATLNSGINNMTVTNFTDSLTLSGGTISDTPALNDFYVGGKLNVGIAQAAGDYTGTFTVTVAYN